MALMPLLTAVLTIQPAFRPALAAPSSSLLAQSPMFLDVSVPSNVVLLMDDSSSMHDTRLPPPPGLSLPTTAGGCPSGQVRIAGGLCVDSADWKHRAPALNRLYYNPALTYKPWNDNGRAGVTGTFTNASTAANLQSNWFREGLTRHDMRYAGPNYAYGVGNNFTPKTTLTGANPEVGVGYPSSAPPKDGFAGAADGTRNQDIFSSPFVWVTSTAAVCTAPFAASSSAQPFANRATSPRPSTPRSYTVRTDSAPNWLAPSTTAPTVTNLAVTNRTISDRTISSRTLTSRTITDRTLTSRGSSARTITTRPTEYRQETGVCGTWGPWTTVPPSTAYCADPGTEGGTRVANIETRLQPCPSGTVEYGASQCATACPSGWTADGTVCRAPCASGYSVYSTTQCISDCPFGASPYGSTQCASNCPSGSTVYSGNPAQCISSCPSGTSTYGSTQCISNCPSGTSTYGSTQCISNCPTGYSAFGTNQCRQNCSGTVVSGGPTGYQCQTCSSGTLSGGQCLSCSSGTLATNPGTGTLQCRSCASGSSWVASPGVCRTDCASGQTPATLSGQNVCLNPCPASHPTAGTGSNLGTCFASCPSGSSLVSGYPQNTCYANCAPGQTAGTAGSPAVPVCYLGCSAPAWSSGGQCRSCPAGSSRVGTTDNCCNDSNFTMGSCPSSTSGASPWNGTCTTANRWYPDLSKPALARYYVYEPPAGHSGPPTSAQLSDPANYRLVQINRDPPAKAASFTTPFINDDSSLGRAIRSDCVGGTTCTWDEEAQNFANWYTYYRTRLFAAIGVTAEALSKLTDENGLDKLRLAYGSINYFPNGPDAYAANPATTRLPSAMTVDGQPSLGGIVRGTRPFTKVSPPPAPGSDDRRQEVFDWLFSLRGYGATPNREALDAVGRYLARTDNRGPWIQPDSSSSWMSSEPSAAHLACRRNYALLITDGEWTRQPETTPPAQPLIELRSASGLPGGFVASQGYAPLTGRTTAGPVHNGSGVAAGLTYQYPDPVRDAPWSNVAGNPTGTLTDVTAFWWSRDLRPDLANNLKPIVATAPALSNPAFWQHMVPYIVGYGISASMDTAATRTSVANNTAVAWPTVVMENRPSEVGTIVTDQDVFPTPATDRCQYGPVSNPSGCGRVNDTLRAALAGRGDFLAANSVAELAQSVAAVFDSIGEQEGSATTLTARSASLRSGDRIYLASFMTGRWTGQLSAYDALGWFNALRNGTAEPAPIWSASFPVWSARTLLTSTGSVGSGTTFDALSNLTPTQRGHLANSADVLNYLRGDQSMETNNGGPFRRRYSLLGDIVNSSPLYSKAPDFGYNAARAPAAAGAAAGSYPAYVAARANAVSGRRAAVYVGANDGMLHAFDAATGQELFGYVPRAVYPLLTMLASPGYPHRYFVDGPVAEGDVYLGGAWRTVLVGSGGAGARSIFALDVTNPEAMNPGKVLWDLTGDDHPDIGHILSPGIVASARDGRWYYFVGNGFESTNDKARLLAIDMQTGTVISLVTDSAGSPANTNGLGGIAAVYDNNRNVVAIYAGDRQGRLWKFDLSNVGPGLAGYSVVKLFEASDSGGNRQPITAAPRVAAHPLGGRYIVFGTGKFYDRDDKADTSVQAVYALWERNPSAPATITKTQLHSLSLSEPAVAPPPGAPVYRSLIGQSGLNWTVHNGWYFELRVGAASGERILSSPVEDLGYINVVSFEPQAGGDPCQGGGRSFYYRLDIATTFSRNPFIGRPTEEIGTSLPPTLAPMPLLTRAPTPQSVPPLSSLGGTDLRNVIGGAGSGVNDPCAASGGDNRFAAGRSIQNVAQRSAGLSCPVPTLRTWRELPRR